MPINVLIVDDVAETRDNVRRLLQLDNELKVVGEAANGKEAIAKLKKVQADVVLMDINMPVMNGLTATEQISFRYPNTSVIMMTVQEEIEYIKQAMTAGASDYVTKPFSEEQLVGAIKKVYNINHRRKNGVVERELKSEPQVVTFFSTKGGVGKTTVATNLAVSLHQITNKDVVLVDLDLQFGDVSAMLNLMPKKTISHFAQEIENMNEDMLDGYLIRHPESGIYVLPAPLRPEYADLISAEHVDRIIKLLTRNHDFVLVDTSPIFNETNMTALDLSNQIFLLLTLDLPSIKNAKLTLEVMESLQHRERVKLVLNRASRDLGLRIEDVERTLGAEISFQLPSEGKMVVTAVNRGIPFVISNPTATISETIGQMAWSISKKNRGPTEKKGLLSKILG